MQRKMIPPIVVVPITTLDPDPYELLRPIQAVVQGVDTGFIATFFDANINASGDTQTEAVMNLRSLLVDLFEELIALGAKALGPVPTQQLSILRSFIQKR